MALGAAKQVKAVVELDDDRNAGAGVEIRRSYYPTIGRPWRMTIFGEYFEVVRELSREDLEAIRDGINEALEDE